MVQKHKWFERLVMIRQNYYPSLTFVWLAFISALILPIQFSVMPVVSQDDPFPLSRILSIDWSPDGSLIAIGGGPAQCDQESELYGIRIIDVSTGQVVQSIEGHQCQVETVAWNSDGTQLVSGSADGNTFVWDTVSEQKVSSPGPPNAFESRIGQVWSPDDLRIADYYASSPNVYIWDASTGRTLFTFQDTEVISSLSWSPNSDRLAVGVWNAVRIVDTSTASRLSTFPLPGGDVISIVWSPDGTGLATGSVDNKIRILDSSTGSITATLVGHIEVIEHVLPVTWSPDGSMLASGSADGSIRVWGAISGEELETIQTSNPVYAVDWSPDGNKLAYGGLGGAIQMASVVTTCETNVSPIVTSVPD